MKLSSLALYDISLELHIRYVKKNLMFLTKYFFSSVILCGWHFTPRNYWVYVRGGVNRLD